MGCMCTNANSNIKFPPEEQTPELKQKEMSFRNLWLPGSIWMGTININGTELPWEIRVERESTPNRITAKRLVNFASVKFVKAIRVDFNVV